MNKLTSVAICLAAALITAGCDVTDSTTANTNPDAAINTPHLPNPGGPPIYGSSSGMGFSTGDAAQSGGQGSGLIGFNHTGDTGPSGTKLID